MSLVFSDYHAFSFSPLFVVIYGCLVLLAKLVIIGSMWPNYAGAIINAFGAIVLGAPIGAQYVN